MDIVEFFSIYLYDYIQQLDKTLDVLLMILNLLKNRKDVLKFGMFKKKRICKTNPDRHYPIDQKREGRRGINFKNLVLHFPKQFVQVRRTLDTSQQRTSSSNKTKRADKNC